MKNEKYADFGTRLIAGIIDCVIMMVIGSMFGRRTALSALTGALYSILLWVNWNGQTVGKRAMKIKVVREDGKPVTYQEAVIRYLSYFVSSIALFLGFFWMIWDEKKQGWHDKIAKTIVVKE